MATDITPIIEAVKRFRRDVEKAGERVLAWPTIDPTFRIDGLDVHGDHVLLIGADEKGRDAMMVLPAGQLAICMVSEPGEPKRGSFGFTSSKPSDP